MNIATPARPYVRSRTLAAAVSAVLTFAAASSHAGPTNGSVTSGNATISAPNANTTRIDQASNSVSINWQSFDVGASESVVFNQPSANAVALNRILSQNPSEILGNVSANGRLFLINPNGIIFGASARINVGSLVASSLDLTDADELNGRYTFGTNAAQSGAIVNQGQITAAAGGSISLLGGTVLNNGLLLANYGSVNLGAGRAATLSFDDAGLIRFQVDDGVLSNAAGASALVDNAGEITGAQVLLTSRQANDVLARAVNNDGVIRATRVENVGGVIRLVGNEGATNNAGTLDASSASGAGGEVQVLGRDVTLSGSSLIDVSGATGGNAYVGGGFAGANPALANAQTTTVDAGALIRADGASGDGGDVAVWADGTTTFNGDISARASGAAGDGGFAEVSGHEFLSIGGHADLRSANGSAGTLLLDPGNVTVQDGANTNPANPPNRNTINDGWINAQLGTGNLRITTDDASGPGETLTVNGDVDIVWASSNDLTLDAGDEIVLSNNSTITNNAVNGGDLILTAGGRVTIGATIDLDGNLSITSGTDAGAASDTGSIIQNASARTITVDGNATFIAGGNGNIRQIQLPNANTFNGTVTARGGGTAALSNLMIRDTTALDLNAVTVVEDPNVNDTGFLDVQAASITQRGAFNVEHDATFIANNGGSINLNQTNTFNGAVDFNSAGGGDLQDVTVVDSNALQLQSLSLNGNLDVTAASITQVNGDVLNILNDAHFTATSGSIAVGTPLTNGTVNQFRGTLRFNTTGGAGDVSFNSSEAFDFGNSSIGGMLMARGPAFTQLGGTTLSIGEAATFIAADNASITLANAGNTFNDTVIFAVVGNGNNLNNISIRDTTALELRALSILNGGTLTATGALTTGGALTVNAALITQSSEINTGTTASFTAAGGGSIVLQDANNSFGTGLTLIGNGTLNNVQVTATTPFADLGPLTLSGNLALSAPSITQDDVFIVNGTSSFAVNNGTNLTLGEANQLTGAVDFARRNGGNINVSLTNNRATLLDSFDLGATGALTVISAGGITQTAGGIDAGTTNLTAGGGTSIILADAGNSLGAIGTLTPTLQNLSLRSSNALAIPTLNLTGNLALNGQTITQTGGFTVAGTSSFAADSGASLTLTDATNSFTGAIDFAGNGGNLANVTLVNSRATVLDTFAVGNAFTLTSAGNITQLAGGISIGGTANLTGANATSILLGDAGNSFGNVTVAASGGGTLQDVTLRDSTALNLQSGLSIAGTLTATSGGALTQGGALLVGQNAVLAGQTIVINDVGNQFSGSVGLTATGNAEIVDSTDLLFGTSTIGGGLNATAPTMLQSGALNVSGVANFNATGGVITLGNANNVFAGDVTLPATLTSLTLTDTTDLTLHALNVNTLVVSARDITQDGILNVTGNSTFTGGSNRNITLSNPANNFTGTVSFASSGAQRLASVTVQDASAFDLSALSVGTLDVTALSITQIAGGLDVSGTSRFAVTSPGSIALTGPSNALAGAVTLAGPLTDATINNTIGLNLAPLTLTGNLTASAQSITQTGAFNVAGTSAFTAAAGNSITLADAGNNFGSTVTFAGSGGNLQNVTVRDTGTFDLGALALAGNLNVNAGSITQTGALAIAGTSAFTSTAGSSITLTNAGNAFGGAVSFLSAGPGNLLNVSVLNNGTLDLQALTLDGALTASATGSITQSGALVIAGPAIFNAGAGQSILLGNAGNNFGSNLLFSAPLQNLTLRNAGALTLGALTLTGNLNLTSGGAVTQTGAFNIAGTSSFATVAGGSINLSEANTFTGPVAFSAITGNLQNVTVTNTVGLDLRALTLTGNLAVNAASITQSGVLNVAGVSSFTAAAGQSITLGNAANTFAGAINFASSGPGNLQNVTIVDSTALDLQTLALNGTLTASGSTLTQSGALAVGGASTFTAAGGQSILLTNAGNAFNGPVSVVASGGGTLQNVGLRNTGALALQTITVGNALDITAGGAITQAGALTAPTATFTTLSNTGAAITLNGTNNFGTVSAAARNLANTANAAGNITIQEASATSLGNIQTTQAASITSAGAITQVASSSITAGTVSLTAAGDVGSAGNAIAVVAPNGHLNASSPGNIFLANTGGGVSLDNVVATGGNVSVTSDGSLTVADVRAGNVLTLASGGSILDDAVNGAGSQLVASTITLQAAGAIGEAQGSGNGQLELQVGSVGATAQGGGVHLSQTTGDLNLRQIVGAGPVSLQAVAGSLVDDAADASAASISSTTGGVQLRALNNIGTVTDLLARQGSSLAVNTNGGALGAQVSSATGQVNLSLPAGSSPTGTPGSISAGGNGQLLIQSPGNLTLTGLNGAITGFGAVALSADGTLSLPGLQTDFLTGPVTTLSIRGGNDVAQTARNLSLAADTLRFESGGQGGDITLTTNVGRLDATVGNNSGLSVVEANDLMLGSIATGGNVSVRAGEILDDGDVGSVTRVTAGDTVTLIATGGIGRADGIGGGRIDTAGDAVSVTSNVGSIFLSHQGDLALSGAALSGSLDAVTPTGDINVVSTLSATGTLTLTAGSNASGATVAGDINLTGTATAGALANLSALGGGAISDANDSTAHLTGQSAALSGAAIGSQANALNTDLGSISATTPGGIYISEATGLQLRDLTGQTIVVGAGGALVDDGDALTRLTAPTVTLTGASIGAAGNEVDTSTTRLAATASGGGIYVDQVGTLEVASITASGAGNDISISASGAIIDDGDNTTRVSGGTVTLGATSIGLAGANGALATQATALSANTTSGAIYVNEVDDLQLNAITAGSGNDIVIAAGGVLTDDANDSTLVTGTNVTLTATRIGATDSRVDTAATTLTATGTAGGIFVSELDGVTLASVRTQGAGNAIDVRTGGNGNLTAQTVQTQGGAVTLVAGGTGSLSVTGSIESNNGAVSLTSGNTLSLPALNTGTGAITLRATNALDIGTLTGGSLAITSDAGNVALTTANVGSGTVAITAANGTINDTGGATALTGGDATLTARSIGSDNNPLSLAVNSLNATSSAGGAYIEDVGGLTLSNLSAAGTVRLATTGALLQAGAVTSGGNALSITGLSIDMDAAATTNSAGGSLTYLATGGDISLAVLNAGNGRALVIASDDVASVFATQSGPKNLTASAVEIRAGGLGASQGQIGSRQNEISISTPLTGARNIYLIVPASNGIQATTPAVNITGVNSQILLKGYTGAGILLFDLNSTFTPDIVQGSGESIVPLANGRVAVNSDSLSAAKQALSSGVLSRVNIDWAAFDPNVSLFGTIDPAVRLPPDQLDEAPPSAALIPEGTTFAMTQDGWKLRR